MYFNTHIIRDFRKCDFVSFFCQDDTTKTKKPKQFAMASNIGMVGAIILPSRCLLNSEEQIVGR